MLGALRKKIFIEGKGYNLFGCRSKMEDRSCANSACGRQLDRTLNLNALNTT